MATYESTAHLLNNYNLTGDAAGTLTVPSISLDLDGNGNYIITYTYFQSYADITSSSYYDSSDVEPAHIIDAIDYNQDIEDAIESILNPVGSYSVLFSDIAKISFQEETLDTGIITFSQMEGSFPDFSSIKTTAGSYRYLPEVLDAPSDRYGDIWINRGNDSTNGGGITPYNVWDESGSIEPGTHGYKILLEEISHSLGIDIYNNSNASRNFALDSHKYTVTSYYAHAHMQYNRTVVPGWGDASYTTESASGNPYPTGLQLYDIAAIQEIYGRNYDTRNTATTYDKEDAFDSSVTNDAFIYTIWDGGGEDTISADGFYESGLGAGAIAGAHIDLRQGMFSSIGSSIAAARAVDNVAVAYYTIIENAIGSINHDTIVGNAWDNVLDGGEGNDHLYGDGEVYNGIVGPTDVESGQPAAASDGSGDDTLIGGAGDDYLYGGEGYDVADYSSTDAYIKILKVEGAEEGTYTVDKYFGQTSATGAYERDYLFSIEEIKGNPVNDNIFFIRRAA